MFDPFEARMRYFACQRTDLSVSFERRVRFTSVILRERTDLILVSLKNGCVTVVASCEEPIYLFPSKGLAMRDRQAIDRLNRFVEPQNAGGYRHPLRYVLLRLILCRYSITTVKGFIKSKQNNGFVG